MLLRVDAAILKEETISSTFSFTVPRNRGRNFHSTSRERRKRETRNDMHLQVHYLDPRLINPLYNRPKKHRESPTEFSRWYHAIRLAENGKLGIISTWSRESIDFGIVFPWTAITPGVTNGGWQIGGPRWLSKRRVSEEVGPRATGGGEGEKALLRSSCVFKFKCNANRAEIRRIIIVTARMG